MHKRYFYIVSFKVKYNYHVRNNELLSIQMANLKTKLKCFRMEDYYSLEE